MTDARIAKALEFAEYGHYGGNHHKMWVIDQMVRALTGCPMVEEGPVEHRYHVQGESEEYLRWRYEKAGGHWDEGVPP